MRAGTSIKRFSLPSFQRGLLHDAAAELALQLVQFAADVSSAASSSCRSSSSAAASTQPPPSKAPFPPPKRLVVDDDSRQRLADVSSGIPVGDRLETDDVDDFLPPRRRRADRRGSGESRVGDDFALEESLGSRDRDDRKFLGSGVSAAWK